MKKTMIALAAIAAVGAASAQVSITGAVAYGYSSTTDGAGATTAGLGMDTAFLKFSATEDLGGGMKASGNVTLNTGNYGALASSDDQTISLSMPAVTVTLGQAKGAEYTMAAAGSVVYQTMDGRVLSARSIRDLLSFSIPLATGLTGSLAYQEPSASGTQGLGLGSVGTTNQAVYAAGLTYATGPAVLTAAFLQYTNVGSTDATSDNVTRLGARANLGMLSFGGGLQIVKQGGGSTNTQASLAASTPLSDALTLGALYSTNNQTGSTLTSGRKSGYALNLNYAMSKRTGLSVGMGSWRGGGASAAFDAADSSAYHAVLSHSF